MPESKCCNGLAAHRFGLAADTDLVTHQHHLASDSGTLPGLLMSLPGPQARSNLLEGKESLLRGVYPGPSPSAEGARNDSEDNRKAIGTLMEAGTFLNRKDRDLPDRIPGSQTVK